MFVVSCPVQPLCLTKQRSVHIPSVPNYNDEDDKLGVVDLVDNTKVPDANAVERVDPGQFLVSGWAGVFGKGVHGSPDTFLEPRFEAQKLLARPGREFNGVGQGTRLETCLGFNLFPGHSAFLVSFL